MQVVDFSDTEFNNIPRQDNPAFDNVECMMLVKEYGKNGITVLHIKPDPLESVNIIATVYDKTTANIICDSFKP